ncbi:DUF4352 domain-containing protein [Streptomyces sp. cmx-4-9]|uniref:DUF4352 domain-containing protein n=1 Tax=Streptomyces sp. cmx-4-9 TaxID=2790941 RepID=UPI00397EFA8E
MSTPPNPPSNPPGPPTEPAGTPLSDAPPIPAPARPTSLEKHPAPADAPPADAPPAAATPAEAPAPAPARPTSLEKHPAPADARPADAPPAATTPAEAPAPAPAPAAATPAGAPAPAPSPFAPPTPQAPLTPQAPASQFAAPGMPGGPGNPWGGPGFTGVPYPTYPQAAPTTNGLAIAALVLGGVGALVGIAPFLFWAGAILGLTGLGLGIGGLVRANRGAPRKAMAVIGIVLGVLSLGTATGGFLLTATMVEKLDEQIDRDLAESDPFDDPSYPAYPSSPAPKSSPSQIPGKTSALPWGGTFTYPDGVEVTVQEATAYTVGKNAYPQERTGRGVKVTVKITNKSDAPIDVTTALPHARDENGTETEMVFDGSLPKLFKGSVMPGESATGGFVFDVAKESKTLHFEISPGLPSDYDDAVWSGPIS